ncbi:hypothetical protein BKA64DRAFT_743865 [Cadophora sp. MPI-SDFR-AT-0126]|nr:hypothetical protein BKA64DRAFT_743865 [Leotiomycetes sp. MPI-SDFR-AT-0126]
MAYRNESLQGQAVSTQGMSLWKLNNLGDFVKFAEMPVELQDKVWEYYVLRETGDVRARDVHVNMVLKSLTKESFWFRLRSKLKKTKTDDNDDNDETTTRKFAISVAYASHSAPSPAPYLVRSRVRTLAFTHLPHRPAIPLPNTLNPGTITKLIPISFTSSDTLTITFPFASEFFLEFLLTRLCPMINKYVRPPAELIPYGWGRDIRVGGSMCDRGDTRVLKGSGAIVWKRNWLKAGRKEGRSVWGTENGEGVEGEASTEGCARRELGCDVVEVDGVFGGEGRGC